MVGHRNRSHFNGSFGLKTNWRNHAFLLCLEHLFDTMVAVETSGAIAEESALGALHVALDLLGSDYLATTDLDWLGTRAVSLQIARQKLDGVLASTIGEAESGGVAANSGQRTMAQYVAARTHCHPEDIRADSRVGSWVRHFCQLDAACLEGRLSRRHINQLRSAENIRVYMAMQRDQNLLIRLAQDLEWPSFKNAIEYWLFVNDPDGDRPEDHQAKNSCTITPLADGRIKMVSYFDPITAASIKEQVETESTVLFDQDQQHNVARTVTQRRAQALGDLIARGAGRTETSAQPLFHVVMSLKVLLHALAQMAKETSEQDFTSVLDPNDIDGRCELADGTPLHPKYALVLLMQARIRRQVLGARSQTLDASVESRLFPKWMKHIRLVETRGQCEVAGCDALHTWLQGDHDKPRSKNGQTHLNNLKNLCTPDNKHKSDGPPMAERRGPLTVRPCPKTSQSPATKKSHSPSALMPTR
ncbi:MAG: hypothetical protein ACI81L_002104 [Verrucomicrobiales bacterium]|jgi:hypothetical protein